MTSSASVLIFFLCNFIIEFEVYAQKKKFYANILWINIAIFIFCSLAKSSEISQLRNDLKQCVVDIVELNEVRLSVCLIYCLFFGFKANKHY